MYKTVYSSFDFKQVIVIVICFFFLIRQYVNLIRSLKHCPRYCIRTPSIYWSFKHFQCNLQILFKKKKIGRIKVHLFNGKHPDILHNRCGFGEGNKPVHIFELRQAFLFVQRSWASSGARNFSNKRPTLGLSKKSYCTRIIPRKG